MEFEELQRIRTLFMVTLVFCFVSQANWSISALTVCSSPFMLKTAPSSVYCSWDTCVLMINYISMLSVGWSHNKHQKLVLVWRGKSFLLLSSLTSSWLWWWEDGVYRYVILISEIPSFGLHVKVQAKILKQKKILWKWCYTGQIATAIFTATNRCNIETMR